jgi:hypothetical protein
MSPTFSLVTFNLDLDQFTSVVLSDPTTEPLNTITRPTAAFFQHNAAITLQNVPAGVVPPANQVTFI